MIHFVIFVMLHSEKITELRESPKFTKNSRIADFFWFVAGARFFFL
jgi:hypothetical protein